MKRALKALIYSIYNAYKLRDINNRPVTVGVPLRWLTGVDIPVSGALKMTHHWPRIPSTSILGCNVAPVQRVPECPTNARRQEWAARYVLLANFAHSTQPPIAFGLWTFDPWNTRHYARHSTCIRGQ
jgi:hypothetical protein